MTISDFYKQIKPVLGRWHEQSHTRHLTFAQRVGSRVKTMIIDALETDTPAQIVEAYTAYNAAVEHEDETFKMVTKSPRTEQLQEADAVRDNTWSGVLDYLAFMQRLGTAAQKDAAKRVSEMADQYKIKNNERYEDQNTHTMQWIQQCEGALPRTSRR